MTDRGGDANESTMVGTIALVVTTVIANLTLALIGIADRGWLTLAIEFLAVPLVNIIILAVAIGRANELTRNSNGWGIAYSVLAFFLPIGAAIATIWGISLISYRGS